MLEEVIVRGRPGCRIGRRRFAACVRFYRRVFTGTWDLGHVQRMMVAGAEGVSRSAVLSAISISSAQLLVAPNIHNLTYSSWNFILIHIFNRSPRGLGATLWRWMDAEVPSTYYFPTPHLFLPPPLGCRYVCVHTANLEQTDLNEQHTANLYTTRPNGPCIARTSNVRESENKRSSVCSVSFDLFQLFVHLKLGKPCPFMHYALPSVTTCHMGILY